MLFPSLRTCEILCDEHSMLPTCFDSKVQLWKVEEKNYGKQGWGKNKLHPFFSISFLSHVKKSLPSNNYNWIIVTRK